MDRLEPLTLSCGHSIEASVATDEGFHYCSECAPCLAMSPVRPLTEEDEIKVGGTD